MPADRRSRRAAPRDPERTRRLLLDAALTEFSAKGLAGARVSEIAARAGVNKQLISYHFDGKQGLYDALAERWLEQEREFAPKDLPLGELVARYVTDTVQQREMARLFVRESMEDAAPQPQAGDRAASGADAAGVQPDDVGDLRRRQARGEVDGALDPAFLLLALQSAAIAGVAFPVDVRRLTGLDPASEAFAAAYGEQLRRLAGLLAPHPRVVVDHVTIGVADLARSRAFYGAALAPLGIAERGGGSDAWGEVEFGVPGAYAFAVAAGKPIAPGMHVAFAARTRTEVDAFHAAALAAGATDNGAPGPRPQYAEHYYGAFVLDPDGYNVEAVCKRAAPDATA